MSSGRKSCVAPKERHVHAVEVEKEAGKIGFTVVRPGFVFGPEKAGIFGNLVKLIGTYPIIPLVGRGKQLLYLVHIQDLADLIFKLAQGEISRKELPFRSGTSD